MHRQLPLIREAPFDVDAALRVASAVTGATLALLAEWTPSAGAPSALRLLGATPPLDDAAVAGLAALLPFEALRDPSCARVVGDDPQLHALGARSLLAVPVAGAEGASVGVLCVLDPQARAWRDDEIARLRDVASLAADGERRRRDAMALQLLHELSDGIARARDVDSALLVALGHLCQVTGWEYAEAWLPDAGGDRLVRSPSWFALDDALASFAAVSASMSFARGEGLPGLVWASGRPLWVEELAHLPAYRRHAQATAAGLGAAVGVPVLAGTHVAAVLVFQMRQLTPDAHGWRPVVASVAAQLGGVLRRRQAEDARQRSEQLLRAIFDSTVQFIGALRPDGTLLEANGTSLAFAGVTRADVVGRPFWETPWWTRDVDRDRLRHALDAAARGTRQRFEVEHRAPDGQGVIVDFSLTPVRDAEGAITLLIAEGHDITERRRAEETLRRSEARLAGILHVSADAIVAIDGQQRVRIFNTGAERIFGYAAHEVLGQPLEMLLPERARPHHRAHVAGFLAGGPSSRWMNERGQIAGRRKNGEVFPAEATIAKSAVGGEETGTVVLRDVTDRRRAEAALADARRQLESILVAAAEGIIGLDASGCVTFANPAAHRLLGSAPGELAGLALHAAVRHARADGTPYAPDECPAMGALRTGEAASSDADVFHRRDGTAFPVEYTSAPVGPAGAAVGVVLTFRDITERRSAERALQALALRDELTGLYNRRGFLVLAEQQLLVARRAGEGCLLFYLDLDGLKPINDALGHQAGDDAIREAAAVLRDTFRQSDVVGRVGGDEFVALAVHTERETSQAVRTRLEHRLAAANARGGRTFRLGLSVGVAEFRPHEDRSLEALMADADAALYEDKRRRRALQPA